jgi:REP element-mobilizing transposase RayT
MAIFVDDTDRVRYLRLLGRVVEVTGWRCLAYCLMGNHVHLLIETPRPNLGAGMQRLHGRYAQGFNRRHETVGHTFQGRYGSTRVRTDEQLLQTARYVALNPVEAGLCATAQEWPWSSYRLTVGDGRGAPAWLDATRLLEHVHRGAAGASDARKRFAAFVAA